MNAKEHLSQIKRLNIQIRQKKEQLEELSVKAQGLRSFDYTADRVQSTQPIWQRGSTERRQCCGGGIVDATHGE